MVVFPNAKINLGLWVLERRDDGFHNIESCFLPIPWCDILEFVEDKETSFTSTGIDIPGPGNNIVLNAFESLKKEYYFPDLRIHLHKQIPIGAGLGGGSADASFLLKAINETFSLDIPNSKLESLAGKLGSDCPFFINNQAKIAKGTGNIFEDINLDLNGKHLSVIYPNIHVPTAQAYQNLKPESRNTSLSELLNEPLEEWKHQVVNDFESSVISLHPEIGNIKDQLYDSGAIYASMSGSGSSVYALSDIPIDLSIFQEYKIFQSWL